MTEFFLFRTNINCTVIAYKYGQKLFSAIYYSSQFDFNVPLSFGKLLKRETDKNKNQTGLKN